MFHLSPLFVLGLFLGAILYRLINSLSPPKGLIMKRILPFVISTLLVSVCGLNAAHATINPNYQAGQPGPNYQGQAAYPFVSARKAYVGPTPQECTNTYGSVTQIHNDVKQLNLDLSRCGVTCNQSSNIHAILDPRVTCCQVLKNNNDCS